MTLLHSLSACGDEVILLSESSWTRWDLVLGGVPCWLVEVVTKMIAHPGGNDEMETCKTLGLKLSLWGNPRCPYVISWLPLLIDQAHGLESMALTWSNNCSVHRVSRLSFDG